MEYMNQKLWDTLLEGKKIKNTFFVSDTITSSLKDLNERLQGINNTFIWKLGRNNDKAMAWKKRYDLQEWIEAIQSFAPHKTRWDEMWKEASDIEKAKFECIWKDVQYQYLQTSLQIPSQRQD